MKRSKLDAIGERITLHRRVLSAAAALIVACWLLSTGITTAQDVVQSSESSVKAAYLYKLPAYVEWPRGRFEQPNSAITIGVLGADDVAEALTVISAGRTVNGRPIRVRRLQSDEGLPDVHVLFLGRTALIDGVAATQGILTVTDTQGERAESVIDFISVNGRIRFEVHLNAAERNGLRLHSGLLDVAARVHGAPR
jgi:hypothetical protein